ncbi:MAG: sugar phosphate isomerase/epimerase [Clostridia bacterium]|nr:sugar phosphate isomerase/epimerase [Clostridia bacterium]
MIKLSGFADEISSEVKVQFEVFNKLGISYFEPRGINGKNISLLNDEEIEDLKCMMAKYNIKVSSIGSPVGKMKISDDFSEHFEMYKHVVKIAKELGTKYIRMFSFYNDGGEWTQDEVAEVKVRLKKLIDYAKEQDVVLLHENEKDIYGESVKRVLSLMQELSCDNFKAVFDPANFVQVQENTVEALKTLRPYVEYFHIKDARMEDGFIVPAGAGDGHIEEIVRELVKEGYDGFLSLEPHLGTFEGLADLELDDKMLSLPKAGEGTFTLAYNELSKIIKKVQEEQK